MEKLRFILGSMIALNIVLLSLNVMLLVELTADGGTENAVIMKGEPPPIDFYSQQQSQSSEPAVSPEVEDEGGFVPPPVTRQVDDTDELFPIFLEICLNVLEREIEKIGKEPTVAVPTRQEIKKAGRSGPESEQGKKMIELLRQLYEEMNLEFPEV